VVPLFVNGENIGQIDIDSNVLNPFSEADERFLEFVNQEVATLFV
jgi:GAF domain-containing protein